MQVNYFSVSFHKKGQHLKKYTRYNYWIKCQKNSYYMKRMISAEIYKLSIFRKHEIFENFDLRHQLFAGMGG